jgi:hypothetical protein
VSVPSDDELLAELPVDGTSIGIRALAAKFPAARFRQIDGQVERLCREGRLHIDRPGKGARGGERQIRRDGDSIESLRRQLAASQSHADAMRAALETIRNTASSALAGGE